MIDKFISEHLLNKEIEIYLSKNEILSGKVIACADQVLTLLKDGKYTFVNIPHIKCIWEK
ncbi:MAG: MM0924 family protein [Candidatus Helarchaeota archaeon]